MNKRDRYQISALFDSGNWSAMYEVPWGQSPVTYAQTQLDGNPKIKEVSIYRQRRFVRSVRAKAACEHPNYRTKPHPDGGEQPFCPNCDEFVEL